MSVYLTCVCLNVLLRKPVYYADTLSDSKRCTQDAFPVFGEANVKQAFSVASAVFQGRHRRTGESVLVSVSLPRGAWVDSSP